MIPVTTLGDFIDFFGGNKSEDFWEIISSFSLRFLPYGSGGASDDIDYGKYCRSSGLRRMGEK